MRSAIGKTCAFALFSCLVVTPAWADLPPPDDCDTAGEACSNAGDSFDQPGTCTSDTCTRGSPDGKITEYECLRCLADAGAGGSGAGGASTGGAAVTGGNPTTAGAPSSTKEDDDDDGCSVGKVGAERGLAGLMLLAGLALLRLGRRR